MEETVSTITVGVITDLAKDGIKYVCEKLNDYRKEINAMDSIDFGDAYETYIKTSYEKIRKVKTLIYNKEPRDLYSIYECINVRNNGNEISTQKVNNLLELGHKIIITGLAGIGKTTMLKHLFLNTIHETGYIPIFVELRGSNTEEVSDIDILEIIYKSLENCGFTLEYEYFEYSMSIGKYIIFYDGFDEVKTEIGYSLGKNIKDISTKYPDNYYIITSRPLEQFIGWNDFLELEGMSLNKKQAINLVSKLEYDKVVKEKFIKALEEEGLFEKYSSFASNPLLLNIMLMTFDERATIPDKLNDFYEQAFATLFNVHDGSKDCFRRNIKTSLGCEDFKQIFAYFCFKSFFNSDFRFTESSVRTYITQSKQKIDPLAIWTTDDYLDDLIHAVCMLVKDGLYYTFSHRSFQEYFAALYTTKLLDDVQRRLIQGWLTENKGFAGDPYFLMLYNMQGNKFNRIVLCPGLKKIKEKYQDGFSIALLEDLFKEIVVKKIGNGKYSTHVLIKDNYLCSILRMTCLFNNYEFTNIDENEDYLNYLTNDRNLDKNVSITFEKIKSDNAEEIVINGLRWIEEQIKFGMKILDEYGQNELGGKRKVSSIMENL